MDGTLPPLSVLLAFKPPAPTLVNPLSEEGLKLPSRNRARADVEYCVQKDGMCRYTIDEKEFAGTVKDVNADMAYLTKHAPIADRFRN